MNSALYYSNYCNSCKKMLETLSKSNLSNINYICIDNRQIENKNGQQLTYILLQNGTKTALPNIITKVPTLLLAENNHILTGNQIYQHLQPKQQNQVSTTLIGEPEPCSLHLETLNSFGVASDNFSFLDQTSEDLLAKGNGGARQLYSYATIYDDKHINIQEDTYKPNKIGEVNLDKLQQQRDAEIKIYK